MKRDIHPDYQPVVFRDKNAGFAFLTRSTKTSDETVEWEDGSVVTPSSRATTYPVLDVDISSASHPFSTGKSLLVDTAGRVERFNRKFNRG